MHWFLDPITNNYFNFEGRSTRKQYWMFTLYYIILAVVVGLVAYSIDTPLILDLYSLALLLPVLGLSVRRLHDIGKSGWWVLIGFIPLIGWIVLLVFYVTDSQPGKNQYGANPKGVTASEGAESSAPVNDTTPSSTASAPTAVPKPAQTESKEPELTTKPEEENQQKGYSS